ncbi:UNVERIFIED_CONTAM: putative methyltransferase PMT2 [Sesamum angustifolium]|uniref:Methyltransferase n=1 Tax=Sesamum angustifolium TaxID=2727405 RepID=A0AAW2MA05_9LAMI
MAEKWVWERGQYSTGDDEEWSKLQHPSKPQFETHHGGEAGIIDDSDSKVTIFKSCHPRLTVEKAIQNWIQYEGNVFRFPGGGTQFPQGADNYIDQLASVIPIKNGTVTGQFGWGAYLWKRNVIVIFAPRDSHEAQVQFALERGVPAVIGVLGTIKLPYPSRAFDMAHCSRCLIPWGINDGLYMREVDRVLRPGGYWVLSGPPINWKVNYKAWKRPMEELQEEQRKIEEVAKLLCWEKKAEIRLQYGRSQ